jgi:long-chain acyl-CoA synthetase
LPNCTTFLDVNAIYGEKIALYHPAADRSLSYAGLLKAVCRVGGGLRALGIMPGDRVGIYLDSTIEFVISYLAIWRAGAVAVPANIVLTADEVVHLAGSSGAKLIIMAADGRVDPLVLSARLPGLSTLVVKPGAKDPWEALPDATSLRSAVHCRFDDLCQLQYTSGTTGTPKGAMLTHGNWIAALHAEVEALGLTDLDVYLGIYPMAHVGVSWGMSALKAGATWVVLERFEMQRYLSLIKSEGATVVASMPPVIHSLSQLSTEECTDLAPARVMISGGGPLHPSVWKAFFSRFGVPVLNAYGLSETIVIGTGTAILPRDYTTADEFMSVGNPVGFSEVKIVDPDNPASELPALQDGEIALRGPSVALGYWEMPAETAEVFLPEGWFLTGDIGHIDDDGMLSITDRKKDMIVMSGWKIYPTEVEKVILQHPAIADAAIFGCHDLHRGEIPVAAVVPSPGEKPDGEEIIAFCRDRLAGYKVPRSVVFTAELPRLGGWKLLRRELREHYCGRLP